MTTPRPDTGGSVTTLSTSSTSGGSPEGDKKTDRRRGGYPCLSTSSTSFSKEGVMCAGAGARAPRGLTSPPSERQGDEVDKRGPKPRRLSIPLSTSGVTAKVTSSVRHPRVNFGGWSA